jgi:outer membrane protein assembly factor BamB
MAFMLLFAAAAHAQDWPQWRGAGRDGVAAFTAPASWPKELTPKWKVEVGPGDATPALVGDRLYVFTRQGDNETLLCMEAATGKELWKDAYPAKPVTGAAGKHPGPRGSPAVADGKVVTLGASGVLSCLDAATGKVLWRNDAHTDAVPQFFTGMSPIIVGGVCVAHLGGKDAGVLLALDLATGAEKWKVAGEGPSYASPVCMEAAGAKQLVLMTEKSAAAFDPADGRLLWKVDAPCQRRFYNSATPVVAGDTVYVTGQGSGTAAMKVEKAADGLAVKEVWRNADVGTGFNTPVLKDGRLYGFSDKGNLFCISASDGKTAWVDETKRGSGNFCAVVDAGSVLVALPADGQLVVFKPAAAALETVATLKVSAAATYATPVLSGNRMFIRDAETVALFILE